MEKKRNLKTDSNPPLVYQIKIEGHLGQQWMDWFEGLTITLEEDGKTLLTGPVTDQAALFGLLKKVRDLGIPLVSVNRVQFNQTHSNRSKIGDKK
jgi:hypothetical protein